MVYLWSNASAEFICTMQPLRPSKDEAQACRYGVQLHSAALLREAIYGRARGMISYAPCTSLARVTADEGGEKTLVTLPRMQQRV